jgi:hypothetical protein
MANSIPFSRKNYPSETIDFFTNNPFKLSLQLEKILQNLPPALRENALRMKLHAPDGQFLVLHAHDFAFLGLSGDLQAIRNRFALDHQRMIPRRRERDGHPFEQILAVMLNR